MKTDAIIVDLDMTLADSSARGHYIRGEVADWDSWHGQTHTDKVVESVSRLCYAMLSHGVHMVFITARSEECKPQTIEWLKTHLPELYENCELYMRAKDDYRSGPEVKRGIYGKYVEPFHNVLFAIDDMPENIEMFASLGIYTLQVRAESAISKK